ncbi:hypothetical protein BX616_002951 [Lobosporangium transversale]|uniref:PUA-like domain-containing protein n=1 Tax=Lobosporangium transversale TaxID=64571 RepID=A0A1Y2GKN2_9FUNG|nr:PUA-like domain-containing protein [Lobosporangium transversale]KAF9916737.1 hypothetical protein BX616_002951 [Lobosporangium transversale]ORZ12546.1 PUA-like domain-containing protein [Lobosporangium transversale]|eukprot:XP_021880165.1 PUA-like domain-containing protein [Lobosporangium transversale]
MNRFTSSTTILSRTPPFSSSTPALFPTRSYRPLQCPTCKELLLNPITLPCGFTVCQGCLPPLETIDFQQQIRCPFNACARSCLHTPDQLAVDVTLQNLSMILRTAALHSNSLANILHEDSENERPHHQPDNLFYGSTEADPTWEATLEGLFDPYMSIPTEPVVSSSSASSSALYRNIPTIVDNLRLKIQQEVECQICFLLFDHPITTYCGHTLCKSCLITSLDHKPDCPLCRRKLPLYMFYHNQPPNKALLRFIQYLSTRPRITFESENHSSVEEREVDPTLAVTPLFINALIFPRIPCYLLVFEPRYRKLLRNVLKTESKLFGMVLPPQQQKYQDLETFAWEPSMEYGTLLKVLSCELLPDGRALVETVGVSRFQILTYSKVDGYYAATAVDIIDDIPEEYERGLEKKVLDAAAATAKEREQQAETGISKSIAESGEEQASHLLGRASKRRQDQETSQSGTTPLLSHSSLSLSPSSSSSSSSSLSLSVSVSAPTSSSGLLEDVGRSSSRQLGFEDLHRQKLEMLSQKQLLQILVAYVAYMQDRLGPLATQRLQREYGEMIEDDGQYLSFWVASVLPMPPYQKYELLHETSVRKRLLTVLNWIKDIETRRSMAVCTIS